MHKRNVIFSKTVTKLALILRKCFFFSYVNPTRYLKCVQDLIVNMVWSEVCSLDLQKVNALCWVIVFKLILKTMSQQRTVNLI